MLEYGVYIGKDIEIVNTKKYRIIYRRLQSEDTLESCFLKNDDTKKYSCIAICRSSPATTRVHPNPKRWGYAFLGQKKMYSNNLTLIGCMGSPIFYSRQFDNEFQFSFWDGDSYSAVQAESFRMEDIHPHSPSVSGEHIGECLKCWNMGCYEKTMAIKNDNLTSVTINTNKHMYIFHMLPNDFYCRAARYTTCNRGVVFNQNFRQRKSELSETYMAEDNSVSAYPLSIDQNSQDFSFRPFIEYVNIMQKHLNERERMVLGYRYGFNGFEKKTQAEIACLFGISRSYVSQIQRKATETVKSYISKSADNNVFWSVSSYSEDQIVLNSCQGDTCIWKKPNR